jgi:predicted SnoaL-like aldol condensation-catalyzing enzyme
MVEYSFALERVAFEVFRFEDGRAVEHWDNLQPRMGPGPGGHGMVEGLPPPSEEAAARTEVSRARAVEFVETVLIPRKAEMVGSFVSEGAIQHDPCLADGAAGLRDGMAKRDGEKWRLRWDKVHRCLAEGDIALVVTEGGLGEHHASHYNMFRFEESVIVELWCTIDKVPPKEKWVNDNGKF